MHGVPAILGHGVALMADLRRRIRLPGVLNLLVAGARYRMIGKRGEHGQADQTSERPKASVHAVILRESGGTNHEIARSVWLELHGGYHTASSQLSRFGNSARENAEHHGTKTLLANLQKLACITAAPRLLREAAQEPHT